MTRVFAALTAGIAIIVLAGCPNRPEEGTFNVRRMDDGTWYTTEADFRGAGTHVEVWVESSYNATVSDATVSSVIATFDNEVFDLIESEFGSLSDVDENGRVTLLLLDVKDGYTGSGGYVAGFFDPIHLFSTVTYPQSNEADMLFMDIYPGEPGTATFELTMAHETQHLANFWYTLDNAGIGSQETWINEGLSLGAEYLFAGGQVASRIDDYNESPSVPLGDSFYIWGDMDSLSDYASGYLFFQWLRIHASNGSGIYRDIFESADRNYDGVLNEAAAHFPAADAPATWDELIADWHLANLVNAPSGSADEIWGYKGELADPVLEKREDVRAAEDIDLGSGQGVVREYFPPLADYEPVGGTGTDVVYFGFDSLTGAVDDGAGDGLYSGDYLLAANTSSAQTTATQAAVVPASVQGATTVERAETVPSPSVSPRGPGARYAVGVLLTPDGFAPNSHRPGPE